MLLEFRVENHRSIRDEQVFTMEAGRTSQPEDPHVREVGGRRVVTAAGFYGANASGKSNLLSALAYMCAAVQVSHRYWDPEGVPRDCFAWGEKRDQPSLYEVTFMRGGIRFQYGFTVDDERILEEWLHAWPERRKQVWFERDAQFKFGEHLKGENRVIEEITRANALFLSVAAQHGHKQLTNVYDWFSAVGLHGCSYYPVPARRMAQMGLAHSGLATILGDRAELENVRRLLAVADVGIVDIKFVDDSPNAPAGKDILLLHASESGDSWLPLSQESAGTKGLFNLAAPVLRTLTTGSVLIIDELERSLHPLLALYIVQQFNSPDTNPKNAQLIFSTHDTNLLGTALGEPNLARDQVWLTEKDAQGGTVVYPLTDYKPRKAENLERGYLQGRYGAIPFLANTEKLVG
jgi:uncharacterized protein